MRFRTAALGVLLSACTTGRAEVFFTTNATWQFAPGTNEASSPAALWRTNIYNASAWTTAPAPFYYGRITGVSTSGGTRLGAMSNNYTCVFLRKAFVVTNSASVTSATLRAAFDDGFIAWLNGREVVRTNMSAGEIAYTGTALTVIGSAAYANFPVTNPASLLLTGTNVLCLQAFNSATNSSDFYANAEFSGLRDATAPTVYAVSPVTNSVLSALTEVTVSFSKTVQGVDAADFLLNGQAAMSMAGSGTQYVFSVSPPPDGTSLVTWATAHGIVDLFSNAFVRTGTGATWRYLIDGRDPTIATVLPVRDSVLSGLTSITVRFSEPVSGVDASDLLVAGVPALSVSGSTTQYVFTVAQPAGVAAVTWNAAHGIVDAFGHAFDHTAPDASWSYTVDTIAPEIASVLPAPGSTLPGLTNITVTFTEPVYGVDPDDFRVNSRTALSVTGSGSQYVFTVSSPGVGEAQITWDPVPAIADGGSPPNYFDGAATGSVWSYQIVDSAGPVVQSRHPPPGAQVRQLTQVEIVFSEPVTGVNATDLRVNGLPASTVQGDLAGPYLFGFDEPSVGAVVFGWAGGHGITDLADPPNPFSGSTWTVNYNPGAAAPLVRINEVMTSNHATNGLKDEDGDLEDWIELYNAGAAAVDLNGWSLSDDAGDPGRWVFPARTLDPGAYLVVYASGKDRRPTAAGSKLHTNFRLSPEGEYLGLWNADSPRQIMSEFNPEYPEQRPSISYGPDLAMQMSYFAVPTPGAANTGTTLTGMAPRVHFNVDHGFFRDPFRLLLSVPMAGASIRYTTDGSEPAAGTGTEYAGSISVTGTAIIRASAFVGGMLPSVCETRTYLFPANVLSQPDYPVDWPTNWGPNPDAGITPLPADYGMDPEVVTDPLYVNAVTSSLMALPTISIVTDPANLWSANRGIYYSANTFSNGVAWERAVSCEWFEADGKPGFNVGAGLRIHGGENRRPYKTPKHAFRLNFKGDYGTGDLAFPVFEDCPVQSFDSVVLRATFGNTWLHWDTAQRTQTEYIRDPWIRQAHRDMGQVDTAARFAHVYLNGLYWGVYTVSERADANFLSAHFGGAKESWDAINSGEAIDGNMTAWNQMMALANAGVASNSAYEALQRYVDVVNLADYMLINQYGGNTDWDSHNWYAGRLRQTNAVFRFFCWDAERVLEATNQNAIGYNNANMPSRVFTQLRSNTEFRLLFADRVNRHLLNDGALTPVAAQARMDRFVTELDAGILGESMRWGDYRRDVYPYGGAAYLYTRDAYWRPACAYIRNTYLPVRRDIMLAQYRAAGLYPAVAAPVFGTHGGPVPKGFLLTMASPSNAIYYTTDGEDPRVYGSGATSSHARVYSGPVALDASLTVKARAWSNSVWSALTEARFQVQELGWPLRITEIMYNPPGGDAYEFIEVRNTSAGALDVGLVHFDEVQFSFAPGTLLAPGEYVVIANDVLPSAFSNRYPGVTVLGYYTGSLPNGGGRISLRDPSGSLIESVDYDDEDGWAREADGRGRSLERTDAEGDPDAPSNWSAAGPDYGTPGQAASPPADPPVRLNEIMSDPLAFTNLHGRATDWVELYNPGAANVDLSGWSLSDGTDPRRFVFPAGAVVSNGGFLVVWCDAETALPGLHSGFGLSREGESVALYDTTTNRRDSVTFGLQAPDFTVGRLPGAGDPWNLCVPTPGASNAAAELASVTNLAVNEWMANPVAGEDDWLELFNGDAARPAPLQGCFLEVSNRLYRIGALSFIQAGGYQRFWADENPGNDHVDFKLPAGGGTIALYDALAAEVDEVTYAAQSEGISSGRLPDGAAAVSDFPGTASPGASNWVSAYTGPRLHEVMARNQSAVTNGAGRVPDWIELYHSGASPAAMDGMSLSVGGAAPGQWVFPAGTTVPAGGCLVVWCDGARPATTNLSAVPNTGRSLAGEAGSVHLFNAAGLEVDSVEYGFQIEDRSIGRVGGDWRLLDAPTPGSPSAAPATLGSPAPLRINEWMADAGGGDDWFEIHNAGSLPVDLTGLSVADTPAMDEATNNVIGALSFIDAGGWVLLKADGDRDAGGDHVGFQLDAMGESLRLYDAAGLLVDAAEFDVQAPLVSEGRLPDGAVPRVFFPSTATPESSNYLPLSDAAINEVLTHTDPPLEDAIELENRTGAPLAIGGWKLSDDPRRPGKYTIPAGTTIAAGGHLVFYEYQFNGGPGSDVPFNLNSFQGDSVLLSEVDGSGQPTGYRAVVSFGPSFNGMSFGAFPTTRGSDFVTLAAHTFGRDTPSDLADFRGGGGLSNAAAWVPPVVVSEIMYHSTNWFDEGAGIAEEYIELHNRSGAPVSLYDPAYPTNRWKLAGAVAFDLPGGVTVPSNGYALVVNFDPASLPAVVAAFRARYGVPDAVPVYGPFSGRLADEGERVEWLAPDTPEPDGPEMGLVPYVTLEDIAYSNAAPWPAAAAGGGASLQRASDAVYGNEVTNWCAWTPSPGRRNLNGTLDDYDGDGLSNGYETAYSLNPEDPADADIDSDGDGFTNRQECQAGTAPNDPNAYLRVQNAASEGGGRAIRFLAAAGRTYTVLRCDDLLAPDWQRLQDIPAGDTDRIETVVDPAAVPTRYYRLVTPALP